jgi:pyruvate formate lyase activating enzyme
MAKKVKEELHEAMLWQKERNAVRCLVCSRECFIPKGKRGHCQVRENQDNKLYALNFGKVVALNIQSIEKNPLFHFYPGSNSLAFGIFGCNLFSNFCPQFELDSKLHEKTLENVKYTYYTPEDIVEMAEKKNCKSITYNFTESSMFFEFAFRTAKLAERSNIKNTLVTNGFISQEAVKKIAKHVDAATVNIAASADNEFYSKFMNMESTTPIFQALRQMKKHRVFVEITNLIVPQVGDNIEKGIALAERISNDLSSETPYHLRQFQPFAVSELPPTPTSTMENFSVESGKAGLRYVYIDSLNQPEENTYCHNCKEVLIQRKGSTVKKISLVQDRCPNCGFKTNIFKD